MSKCPHCGTPGGTAVSCSSCQHHKSGSSVRGGNSSYHDSSSATGGGGCFAADTPVLTPVGWVEISQLRAGGEVMTWSPEGELTARPVFHVREKAKRQCMRLVLDSGGVLNVTPAHPLRVANVWKRVDQVRVGDILPSVARNGHVSEGRVVEIQWEGIVADVYHLYCGREHTYVVAHAISHCFSFARPLCGLVLDAAIALSGLGRQTSQQAACA